mgnify:CR=1 FL=1
MKVCRMCGEEKPFTKFHKRKDSKDGLQLKCKPCMLNHNKKYHEKHRKESNDYQKKYRNTDIGKQNMEKWKNKWGSGVYGIYENGVCLYIGESQILTRRIAKHKSYNSQMSEKLKTHFNWIIGIIEQTDNHQEREKFYINKLKPLYNDRM